MPDAEATPKLINEPPPDLVPFTCPWAQDGLRRALEGMGAVSTGVSAYHIGTRGLKYHDADKQVGTIGWWDKMVQIYCGTPGLPSAVTGDDTAFRVILRDV